MSALDAGVSLRLDLTPERTDALLTRGPGQPDSAWRALQAAFGYGGTNVNSELLVPLATLLSGLDALAGWPDPGGVQWDEVLAELVVRYVSGHNALDAVPDDASADVPARLAGSRWAPPQELRPFQVRDIGRLLALPNGMNFSVPGAGKTRVTAAVYEAEHHAGRIDRLLVVAPNSAFESWTDELALVLGLRTAAGQVVMVDQHLPQDAEVCIVNYPRLMTQVSRVREWVASGRTMVVFDEAHRAKRGDAGQWGRACLTIAPFAVRRDVLTGTPAPQSARDLPPLLSLAHLAAGPARVGDVDAPVSQVAAAIRPLFVRTNKAELGLPDLPVKVKTVPMRPLHADLYQALCGHLSTGLSLHDRLDFARMGRVTYYLLMAATNPRLLRAGGDRHDPISFRVPPLDVPTGGNLAQLLDAFADYGPPAKYEEVLKLARANAELGRKTIVWSTFVRNSTSLRTALAALQPAVVNGSTPLTSRADSPSRQDEITRFRRDPDCWVLLANPASLGEGISLHHDCQDAIYLDRSFNAGQYLQSVDRIHRLGMLEEARVTILSSAGTIDTTVDARLEVKVRALADLLADDALRAMSEPDEDEPGELLDVEDLEALFNHLAGTAARRP